MRNPPCGPELDSMMPAFDSWCNILALKAAGELVAGALALSVLLLTVTDVVTGLVVELAGALAEELVGATKA